MNLDNTRDDQTRDREPAREAGAADLTLGTSSADRRGNDPGTPVRKRRGGFGLLLFLFGLAIGAVVATIGPRYAQPYLGEMGAAGGEAALSGQVIEKRVENDRLLLRVLTDEGVSLTAFTRNLGDLDMLIAEGDQVEFGPGPYEPFLHDPSIRRVRPAAADHGGEMPVASAHGSAPAAPHAGPAGHASPAGTDQALPSPPAPAGARADFERRMEGQLAEFEAEVEALEERLAEAGSDINEAARRQVVELNKRGDAARARLAEFRAASASAWQELRTGLEQAWADLSLALQEARSHFAQGDGQSAAPAGSSNPPPQGSNPSPDAGGGGPGQY